MANWAVELRARGGLPLADVTVPFKVRRGLNEAAHVSFTLDHEDEAAALLLDELTRGIPQVACYRDGVLWARGWWQPMEEASGPEGTTMACVFRGPFAELEDAVFDTAYGAPAAPITLDQGLHILEVAEVRYSPLRGLRAGTHVASVTRARAYPAGKNRAEAIMQLTEVINGAALIERPVAYLDYGGKTVLAELDTAGSFGTDRSATVIFEHGFGASNVLTINRQIGRPVNYVVAQGAEYVAASGTTYRYVSSAQDTASANLYGWLEEVLDLPDVTNVTTLQEHAQGALRPAPPQAVTFTPDASGNIQPWTSYWLGDTIRLLVDRDALQIDMTARVRAVEIEVDADGNEAQTLEIGDRRVKPLTDTLRRFARTQRALARHETSAG